MPVRLRPPVTSIRPRLLSGTHSGHRMDRCQVRPRPTDERPRITQGPSPTAVSPGPTTGTTRRCGVSEALSVGSHTGAARWQLPRSTSSPTPAATASSRLTRRTRTSSSTWRISAAPTSRRAGGRVRDRRGRQGPPREGAHAAVAAADSSRSPGRRGGTHVGVTRRSMRSDIEFPGGRAVPEAAVSRPDRCGAPTGLIGMQVGQRPVGSAVSRRSLRPQGA